MPGECYALTLESLKAMTIAIPPALEERLKDAASRAGLRPDDYAAKLIERGLPDSPRNSATLALLAKWETEQSTDDPQELERRRQEFERFKLAMNRNRIETDGPDARVPFP
jgi:hypothetical protein